MNDTPTAQITALLQRYARLLDAGDFSSAAKLFSDAAILVNGQHIGTGSDFVHVPPGAHVVMVGHHHDTMKLRNDTWSFTTKDYGDITYIGDTSHHLRP